jgi:hypothetical protein
MAENKKNDPHKHEAVPGAKGVEALGSGQPLPDAAVEGMSARLADLEPEPPKIGPVQNVDLYDTPGGWQVVPAGMKPEEVGVVKNRVEAAPANSNDTGESKKVAGPGSSTVK